MEDGINKRATAGHLEGQNRRRTAHSRGVIKYGDRRRAGDRSNGRSMADVPHK